MSAMTFDLQRFANINNSYNNYSVVSGTSGDDTISNGSQYSTILGDAGNDYISNSGSRNVIDAGAGNDTIKNSGITHWSSLNGGVGNDSIYNEQGSNVTICGGTGDDTIRIKSLYAGNNVIQYSEGDGNDYFINEWDDSNWTLQIGDGTGTYSSQTSGWDIIITVGDGKITLANAANLSNVNIAGTYSTNSGGSSNSKLITGTENADNIHNTIEGATILALGGNDTVFNYGSEVSVDGGAGDDELWNNTGNNVTLNGGAGDDKLFNTYDAGSKVSLNGGEGNDSITNWGADNTIIGGEGNDYLYNSGDNVTLDGGAGNDSLTNNDKANVLFKYASGDGNDLINGFNATSTLTISNGTYSTTKSGDDLIVTVGEGKITLRGAASLSSVNILGEKSSDETNSWKLSGTTATYGTDSNTLVKVTGVKSLGGISLSGKVVTVAASALNKSKVTISNGYTLELADDVATPKTKKAAWGLNNSTATYKSSYKTEGYKLASDSKSISYTAATTAKGLATIQGAKSKSFTVSGKKITLKNSALNKKVSVSGGYNFNFASDYKKATISGSTSGDTITTNGSNLSVNGGAGDDTLKIFGTKTTVKGGDGSDVFIFKAGSNVIADYSEEDLISLAGAAQITTSGNNVIFTAGSNKITVTGGADKTISYVDANGEQTYTATSSDVSINGKTIVLLEDYTDDSFNVATYGDKLQTIDASAVQLDLEIIGNALRNSIKGGANNETLIGGKGNDILTGGDGNDVFIWNKGDGNDLITDYTEDDTINITGSTVKKIAASDDKKDLILTLASNNKITLKAGADKVINYSDDSGENSYSQFVKFNDAGTGATLKSTYVKDDFNISNYGGYADDVVTINATAVEQDLVITANKKNNVVTGGQGNDTIAGGKGNDKLYGGKGSDVFVYSSGDGNDTILDYNEEDKIQITSGKVKSKTIKGDDVIFSVGSGKITVKGAKSKTVTYIDANGKTNYYPTTPSSPVILTDNKTTAILRETYSDSTYTAGNKIKKIDASSVTRDLTITGNSKANVILGSYENDTIHGRKGNDTLQGGSGADVFVYKSGDGNDRIVDYAEEDLISISGAAQVSTSGGDVVFTIGSGKITLLGAANQTVTYYASGKKKTYAGSIANVLEDDNFISSNDLSSIVESKAVDYAFAQESLIQKNNQLPSVTYSTKK